MLTREHAITHFDFEKNRVRPDRLTRLSHGQYRDYARKMLLVYKTGVGRTRQELHRSVRAIFSLEEDCPTRRIEAFCKLLDDVTDFDVDRRGQAAQLRRQVFRQAAPQHPLVRKADRLFEREEDRVKEEIARQLDRPWSDIDAALFADVWEFQKLVRFTGYDGPEALLARYNVAQVQAALYDAVSLTVWITTEFKTVLRYAKLCRLMHSIIRTGSNEYRVRFDGPASVLRETRRYGTAMAKFLPPLIATSGWRLHAVIRTRRSGWSGAIDLSSEDGLTSHLPSPDEFDSTVEESFASKWGSEPRDGWQLIREGELLYCGQKVFVPDFVFRHADGRLVLLEIIGFWTPEYLQAKFETLRTFSEHRILLAIAESSAHKLPELAAEAITYKTALLVKDVLERLSSQSARQE